jgi:hypothetical protein
VPRSATCAPPMASGTVVYLFVNLTRACVALIRSLDRLTALPEVRSVGLFPYTTAHRLLGTVVLAALDMGDRSPTAPA